MYLRHTTRLNSEFRHWTWKKSFAVSSFDYNNKDTKFQKRFSRVINNFTDITVQIHYKKKYNIVRICKVFIFITPWALENNFKNVFPTSKQYNLIVILHTPVYVSWKFLLLHNTIVWKTISNRLTTWCNMFVHTMTRLRVTF